MNASGGGWDRVKQGFGRMFGPGTTVLDWAVPLYRAWGIRVRIHLIFVIMIVVELLWALGNSMAPPIYVVLGLSAVFLLVLLHEYGHCLACRWVGGEADDILMWPLGGLAYCRPPNDWRSSLITTLGGPGVNVVLVPVLAGAVLALGQGWSSVIFNPFDPWGSMATLRGPGGAPSTLVVAVWWFHYINMLLLVFNMLLPMYPMDGGRVLQELLWWRIGYERSLRIAATVGLVVAVVLFVVAITGNQARLMALAMFAGLTCWNEKRRVEVEGAFGADPVWSRSRQVAIEQERSEERSRRRREKQREQAQRDQAELDRLLAKIAREGMASLTSRERKWLSRESSKRRGG